MTQIETISDVSRLDQLGLISEATIDGRPIMVHGSLAHSAVRGAPLPSEVKRSGRKRDIDVFTSGRTGKLVVEAAFRELELTSPSPIDAGLCGLLICDDSGNLAVHKDGITVELDDPEGVFEQTVEYEIVGGEGRTLRSFTPMGLFAVHSLEPQGRVSHCIQDKLFKRWCEQQGIVLPDKTKDSISEFHKLYRERYPYGAILRHAAYIYTTLLPEHTRVRFRKVSHRVMKQYAGRDNPFE